MSEFDSDYLKAVAKVLDFLNRTINEDSFTVDNGHLFRYSSDDMEWEYVVE